MAIVDFRQHASISHWKYSAKVIEKKCIRIITIAKNIPKNLQNQNLNNFCIGWYLTNKCANYIRIVTQCNKFFSSFFYRMYIIFMWEIEWKKKNWCNNLIKEFFLIFLLQTVQFLCHWNIIEEKCRKNMLLRFLAQNLFPKSFSFFFIIFSL